MPPQEIYEMFKKQTGSNAISGIATLEAIVHAAKNDKPKTVLELGGGIGTISYAILKNCDAVIDIYEHDEFCRKTLAENLKGMEARYAVISDYAQLPPRRSYDIIVVDGGSSDEAGYDGGFNQAIGAYIQSLENLKTVIVEGQRKSQKYWILKALRTRFVYNITVYPDSSGGKKIGTRIDCRRSSSELARIFSHFYQRRKIF